jgi:hypothetical protein
MNPYFWRSLKVGPIQNDFSKITRSAIIVYLSSAAVFQILAILLRMVTIST